ncbi:MAG: hypothetical protein E7626_02585 [Ruminococcaceae bacterium]|nr:hypothetical protein [Oscillospiraceae bacterium]
MLKNLRIFSALLLMLTVSLVLGVTLVGCDLEKEDEELHIEEGVVSGLLYEVTLNGETLFTTESLEGYFAVLAKVEETMTEALGYPHSVENDLDIKLVAIETTATVASSDDMYSTILSKTKALYSDCYAIYLDGNVLGHCPLSEKDHLSSVVADIVAYVSEKDNNRNEKSTVYATLGYAKTSTIVKANDLKDAFLSIKDDSSATMDALDGNIVDIIESIDSALLFGSSSIPEDLDAAITSTTERVVRTETEAVAYGHVRRPDTDFGLKYGDDDPEFVHIKGKDGQCTVEYEDVYIDGVYSHTVRIDSSVEITVAPVDEVTVYGTQSTTWDGGKFSWPTVGWVTSEYGPRKAPVAGASTYHKGIDIARSGNPKIVAAAAGEVIKAGWSDSYGWHLKIDHGNGVITLYAHMNKRPVVTVGERVYEGEYIGNMGRTGRVSGAHLHFEVYVNENRINPRKYLSGNPKPQW